MAGQLCADLSEVMLGFETCGRQRPAECAEQAMKAIKAGGVSFGGPRTTMRVRRQVSGRR